MQTELTAFDSGLSFEKLLQKARETSWKIFGKKITFYLPGMIRYGNETGLYPAISVTGKNCELKCEHCNGRVLEPMISATTPESLVEVCLRLNEKGYIGCLLSGGSDLNGVVPWDKFIDAIAEIKKRTKLSVSIHTGIISLETAKRLKDAGVDQALIDVIGDDETVRRVYHLENGTSLIYDSLKALHTAGIPMVPHIVVGLSYGEIKGEIKAIGMLREFNLKALVIVVFTPFKDTPMELIIPPPPKEIAKVIALARINLPDTLISLGCERNRGRDGFETEVFAIDAGINRIAIQSDYAIKRAQEYGLEINYQKTCCSINNLVES